MMSLIEVLFRRQYFYESQIQNNNFIQNLQIRNVVHQSYSCKSAYLSLQNKHHYPLLAKLNEELQLNMKTKKHILAACFSSLMG